MDDYIHIDDQDLYEELERLIDHSSLQHVEPLHKNIVPTDKTPKNETVMCPEESPNANRKPVEPLPKGTPSAATPSKIDRCPRESIAFLIYSYKKKMVSYRGKISKLCRSKLALTEELMLTHLRKSEFNNDYFELDDHQILQEMQELEELENYRTKLIRMKEGRHTESTTTKGKKVEKRRKESSTSKDAKRRKTSNKTSSENYDPNDSTAKRHNSSSSSEYEELLKPYTPSDSDIESEILNLLEIKF